MLGSLVSFVRIGTAASWMVGLPGRETRGRHKAARCLRYWRTCCLMRWTRNWNAGASVFGRKFLGFSFWVAPGGKVPCKVASKPLATFKQRVRRLTRRCVGRSLEEVVERLRVYLLGWKGYYQLVRTPRIWRGLDEWLRHRLRAIQLKQWKRGKTMYLELLALGAKPAVARRVAANSRCWWRNSAKLLNSVLTIAYFDRLGLPRLS